MSGTSPDDHESYHLAGMAGLYALDALEGEDLERFEAHLANNVELQEEVAGFRATTARLSEVSAASPPPALRNRVLADIGNIRQDPPVVRLDDRRQARVRRRVVLTSIAAALVVLAGFGGYLVADRTGSEPSQLASVLAERDAVVVPLTGVGSDVAAGRVVVSQQSGKVVIVSDKMPPVAKGRTYELWRLDDAGAAHKAGLFKPDSSGKVVAALEVNVGDATGFAITDEPDGGSPQATTPVLMTASLA